MTAVDTTFAPQERAVHPAVSYKNTTRRIPTPERDRRRLAGVSATQGVVWELAVAAVAAAGRGWPLYVAGGAGAVAVLLTVLRFRGRWLYQWIGVWIRFRLRRHRHRTDEHSGPLRELAPDLTVVTAGGRRGSPIGVVHDDRSWLALLSIAADEDVLPNSTGDGVLALHTLADALAVDDIRLSAVQVIAHATPAPGLLAGNSPAAASYAQLNAGRVPATRATWIALRLTPEECPAAIDARGGGVTGTHRALRRCAARAVELLDIAGLRAHPLDQEQVRVVLAAAAGIRQSGVDHTRLVESWRTVSCDGLTHLTFWLHGWSARDSLAHLLELCAALPALFATVSLTVTPGRRLRTLVRVSAPARPAALAAGSALETLARRHGWRLTRLDGEHVLGLVGTVPLGGRP
jgi:type VII secretion protein EccE